MCACVLTEEVRGDVLLTAFYHNPLCTDSRFKEKLLRTLIIYVIILHLLNLIKLLAKKWIILF